MEHDIWKCLHRCFYPNSTNLKRAAFVDVFMFTHRGKAPNSREDSGGNTLQMRKKLLESFEKLHPKYLKHHRELEGESFLDKHI